MGFLGRHNELLSHGSLGGGQARTPGLGGGLWRKAVLVRAPSQGAPEDAALAAAQVNWTQSWKAERPSCSVRPQAVMAADVFIKLPVTKPSFRLCCRVFFQLDLHQSSALQKVLIHSAQGYLTGFSEDCRRVQHESWPHGICSYLSL